MVTRLTIANRPCIPTSVDGWLQCWLAGYWLRVHLFTMSLTYTTTNILCTATDVGMHGLLAIVNRVTILCYPLVWVHCWPVADFFIAKQTSLHPFDFVRNLFHYLFVSFFIISKICGSPSPPTHYEPRPTCKEPLPQQQVGDPLCKWAGNRAIRRAPESNMYVCDVDIATAKLTSAVASRAL